MRYLKARTASIGLKNLIPALKLMDNYKIIQSKQVVDEAASGCVSCPHLKTCKEHTSSRCNMCFSKVYKIIDTPVYINEKNRFGEKKTLKRNALLLLLYLHFLHPDHCGLVTLSIKDAADFIGCDERTIRNNMELLDKNNYICKQKGLYPGTYRAFIQSYNDYFLPANKGGRGFITLSCDTLTALVKEKNLNSIRLSLRVLVSSVDSGIPSLIHKEHTLTQIRQLLPSYCCNKTLKEAFSSSVFHKLFEVSLTAYTVYLDVKHKFHPANVASELKSVCADKVQAFLKELNDKATKLGYKHGKHWFPTKEQLADIHSIALQYDVAHILNAMQCIYHDFILRDRPIDNLGALVRTVTSTNARYFSVTE